MIDPSNSEGWIFRVAPMSGESFGHYLGRFRRANCLSQSGLAELVLIARPPTAWIRNAVIGATVEYRSS